MQGERILPNEHNFIKSLCSLGFALKFEEILVQYKLFKSIIAFRLKLKMKLKFGIIF